MSNHPPSGGEVVSEEALRYWLALLHAPGVGPRTFAKLLQRVGDPALLFAASSAQLEQWGVSAALQSYLRAPDWSAVARDLAWADGQQRLIVSCRDARYPPLLLQIHDPPPLLYVHGNPEVLTLPQLAMVGSRNPTPQGRTTAYNFARDFANAGLAITSGMALGIDSASHHGCLAASGVTLAVTGTGLDRVYPASHRDLAHRIVEQGALLSEFPIGTPPRGPNFPRRNRMISGLSVGTLVIEATLRSGSLITARCAIEQGREVFAIPGSICSPQARGCHQLIREGAKLVEQVSDVMEELGSLLGGLACPEAESTPQNGVERGSELDQQYQQLLLVMGYDSEPLEVLMARSGLGANVISSMLLRLELDGYVAILPGGRYCRTEQATLHPENGSQMQ